MRLFRPRSKDVPLTGPPQDEEPHVRKPRKFRIPIAVRPLRLLISVVLIGIGVLGLALNLGYVDAEYLRYWPGIVIAAGLVMALLGGIRMRREGAAEGFLVGGLMLAGAGGGLLTGSMGYAPWHSVVAGAVTMTFGLGVVLRGLLVERVQGGAGRS